MQKLFVVCGKTNRRSAIVANTKVPFYHRLMTAKVAHQKHHDTTERGTKFCHDSINNNFLAIIVCPELSGLSSAGAKQKSSCWEAELQSQLS